MLYIVGIGPGARDHITFKARDTILSAEAVVGYRTYLDLIPELVEGKEIISTGMTQETDRCEKAIELALQGKKVAIISSGDAGIYGMAGLVFELLRAQNTNGGIKSEIVVEVIPGVPALCAASALLGAPLMHDFASISLSDLLTSWDTILKRIEAAAMADFVIVLYNPKSKKRATQLMEAVNIISQYRPSNTPVGIVKDAMREREEITVTTLKELSSYYNVIDMTTTLIVGNSQTFVHDGKMVTPRGYKVEVERGRERER